MLQVRIGFRSYYYQCLDYYFLNLDLIVGLTVGLGIPALIAISVALFFCIRKLRSRKTPPPDGGNEDVGCREFSFKSPPPPSHITTLQQNPKPNTKLQDTEMSILRNSNANGYSSEIQNDNYLQSQDGDEPKIGDVAGQTDDVAACPQNYYRRTIYPPDYLQSADNEYLSSINDDSADFGAYDNRSGQSGGVGGLKSHSKQSHIPSSFGNFWENYDNIISRSSDE